MNSNAKHSIKRKMPPVYESFSVFTALVLPSNSNLLHIELDFFFFNSKQTNKYTIETITRTSVESYSTGSS